MISDKGLQVKNRENEWVHIDPIPNTFVINIGDILEKMTRGLYKSTPHRVKNL
jgi:isopenicillin N synthase-like dioxygenase